MSSFRTAPFPTLPSRKAWNGGTAAAPGSSTITTAALRRSCYSGLSYSTDNGVTWHASQPLCTGHGTNFGDPIVVYNANLGMWFAGDLATSCAARVSAYGPRLTASPGVPAPAP